MITRRTKIRQHLRSARATALTPEERLEEMRAAVAHGEERRAASADAGACGSSAADAAAGAVGTLEQRAPTSSANV